MSDMMNKLIEYETVGFETEEEFLDLFQELVNTGMAWKLQGSYGRTAHDLIVAGLINDPRKEVL